MNRLTLLMIYFCCFAIFHTASAQDEFTEALNKDSKRDTKSYTIQSLEGESSVIHIMPDYGKNVLKISCLKDTITIFDYWGAPAETYYLSEKFLQIKYEVRGGSNLGLGNILLLCVSGNKLYEALHILRYADWESGDLIKKYNVNFLFHTYKKSYVLTGFVNERVISENEPETNYHFYNRTDLQFDSKLKVFYSIKDDLDDTLNVSYPSTGIEYKREIQGTFPKVLLGKLEYFFIGNQWFEVYNSVLTKY